MSMSNVHEIIKVSERGRRDCRCQRARYMKVSRSVSVVDEIADVNVQGSCDRQGQ